MNSNKLEETTRQLSDFIIDNCHKIKDQTLQLEFNLIFREFSQEYDLMVKSGMDEKELFDLIKKNGVDLNVSIYNDFLKEMSGGISKQSLEKTSNLN